MYGSCLVAKGAQFRVHGFRVSFGIGACGTLHASFVSASSCRHRLPVCTLSCPPCFPNAQPKFAALSAAIAAGELQGNALVKLALQTLGAW